MLTAVVAALALWMPAPWASLRSVDAGGHRATFSYRTDSFRVDGRVVAHLVPCGCRAGFALRNVTHGRLTVRYIPT